MYRQSNHDDTKNHLVQQYFREYANYYIQDITCQNKVKIYSNMNYPVPDLYIIAHNAKAINHDVDYLLSISDATKLTQNMINSFIFTEIKSVQRPR